jgi:hypothetical protein
VILNDQQRLFFFTALAQGRTQGAGAAGLQPSQIPQNRNLKSADFVDMISSLLRDLPFSRNQPLKSADDQYIRILKNKLIRLKKQEDRTL